MEHEGDSDTTCNWCTWNNLQKTDKETGRLENKRTSRDHPNYSIIKIDQNSEKSPGNLKRLAITLMPGKNHRQTLVGRAHKEVK